MKEISLSELKLIQLDILKDVHNFCVLNRISYSLAFGTLLGAVRHKGYIPWDDDIDIMMPRQEYEKFLNSYSSNIYKIAEQTRLVGYHLPFAKVYDDRTIMNESLNVTTNYGIYIDVFPVDNIPDSDNARFWFYKKKSFLNFLHILKVVKVKAKRNILKNAILILSHILLYPIKMQWIIKQMDNHSKSYQKKNTKNVAVVVPSDNRKKWIIPSALFNEYVNVPFENVCVHAIKKYDYYLTATYGDYTCLPPVEKRISHHSFRAWWKKS